MNTAKNSGSKEITIDLAMAFDQNYSIPVYALLASLFLNNRGTRFRFHVIATGISSDEEQQITQYVTDNYSIITFYTLSPKSSQGLILQENKHVTISTYYRLFFPELVPADVKRLLYLDTDLIVNGDLTELYTLEMGDYPAAAVPRVNGKPRPELGIYEKGTCFNSGVMLMNLHEWKRQKISEKSIAFVQSFPEPKKLRFADQDALNAVLKNNYYLLDTKYNFGFFQLPKNASFKHYKALAKDVIVVHYNTIHKPWNRLCKNRLAYLYFHYLKLSPKANSKKFPSFRPTLKNLFRLMKIKTQESICDFAPFLAKRLTKTYLWNKG